jgi:hypothetical protein
MKSTGYTAWCGGNLLPHRFHTLLKNSAGFEGLELLVLRGALAQLVRAEDS